jgi:hypothetical protein
VVAAVYPAVGGDGPGSLDTTTTFPAVYRIDDVRAPAPLSTKTRQAASGLLPNIRDQTPLAITDPRRSEDTRAPDGGRGFLAGSRIREPDEAARR